jgi:hypothetical protein
VKKLPLGIQNFKEIIDDGYVYVDKTEYIYDLLNEGKHYFLSRPRRFGKSLLLDTIAEAFGGDRELFKGLFLYDSGHSFEMHPVIRLDMSNVATETPEILKGALSEVLRNRIKGEGLDIDSGQPSGLFRNLIEALCKKYGKRVVVLIDEYDKPILDHLGNPELAEANRSVIKGFYGILKSMDACLRMTFITGVSKFTKTSIFSELNNLFDITLTREYANICGVPIDDLDKYFGEHVEKLSLLDEFKHCDNFRNEVLAWYDGYSWDGRTRVINPFALLSFLRQKRFSSFWYSSGSPKFLIDLIKTKPESFLALKNLEIDETILDSFDIQNLDIEPLLFQTGYLTVKEIRHAGVVESYLLKMPNLEVEDAFHKNIVAEFTGRGGAFASAAYSGIGEALRVGNLRQMLDKLKSLFASIPYNLHIDREAYYHSIFYAAMKLLGFDVDAEVATAKGRIDATLELEDKVYVMEFKYKDCPPDASPEEKRSLFDEALEEGMRQIKDRGYADKYEGSGKAIYQAAFAFLGRDDIDMQVVQSEGNLVKNKKNRLPDTP